MLVVDVRVRSAPSTLGLELVKRTAGTSGRICGDGSRGRPIPRSPELHGSWTPQTRSGDGNLTILDG